MSGGHFESLLGPANGFSLVELLVALALCALVSAGIAAVVPAARVAFEQTPAEMELQQRGRIAVESIAQLVRGAGGDVVAADGLGPWHALVPSVIPGAEAGGRFTRLTIVSPRPQAAQGVLAANQQSGLGPLFLAHTGCPGAQVLCGFAPDAEAIIFDGSGRFDVFTVASVDQGLRYLTADRSLTAPYAAGSVVVEADVHTLRLDPQPDGSLTLVRVTAAGAVQPMVDRVHRMAVDCYTWDATGSPMLMPPSVLSDGPWLRGDPQGDFDEDVRRVRHVEFTLTLLAAAPSKAQRTFRFGVVLRNAP